MAVDTLGINYPWREFGSDFGPPIVTLASTSGQSVQPKAWKNDLVDTLAIYALDGLTVVRWFIYADGWNLPITFHPNQSYATSWSFDVKAYAQSRAAQQMCSDFRDLLDGVQSFNRTVGKGSAIRIMPVVLSYKFFSWPILIVGKMINDREQKIVISPSEAAKASAKFSPAELKRDAFFDKNKPANVPALVKSYFRSINLANPNPAEIADWRVNVKGGKAAILDDLDTALDCLLSPLLTIGELYDDVIYAWDICNEPDYLPPESQLDSAAQKKLKSLLQNGVKRTNGRGFQATVGFSKAPAMREFFRSVKDAKVPGLKTPFINQVHYYPDADHQSSGAVSAQGLDPLIIGEVGVSGPLWPSEKSANRVDVAQRITEASSGGARMVFLWSTNAGDQYSHWDTSVSAALPP